MPHAKPPVAGRPVLLLGQIQRTGTHWLHELLLQHPLCVPVAEPRKLWSPRWEDALLRNAHLLTQFADVTRDGWHDTYPRDELGVLLTRKLGDGILDFLRQAARDTAADPASGEQPSLLPQGFRPVSKQPSVANLHLVRRLFPDTRPIVLVRDGRSVVASGMKGFGWRPEWGIQMWAAAARTILGVLEADPEAITVVRYEDLLADLRPTLTRAMQSVALDVDAYPFEDVDQIPVVGSSYVFGEAPSINWTPRDRPVDFDPRERFGDWPRARLARFDWVAGELSERLGYPRTAIRGATATQHALDAKWAVRQQAARLRRMVRH